MQHDDAMSNVEPPGPLVLCASRSQHKNYALYSTLSRGLLRVCSKFIVALDDCIALCACFRLPRTVMPPKRMQQQKLNDDHNNAENEERNAAEDGDEFEGSNRRMFVFCALFCVV